MRRFDFSFTSRRVFQGPHVGYEHRPNPVKFTAREQDTTPNIGVAIHGWATARGAWFTVLWSMMRGDSRPLSGRGD